MRENSRRCSFHPARRIWRMVLARMSRRCCGRARARDSPRGTATKVRERAPEAEGKRAVSTRISRTAEASGLAVRKIPVKPIDSIPVASAVFASYVVTPYPASEVRKLALIAIPAFPLSSDSDVPKIACSVCGGNAIIAPDGTTEQTRYLCRKCCARIAREQSAERRRLAEENSSYGRRMANIACRLLERGNNPDENDDATTADSTLE